MTLKASDMSWKFETELSPLDGTISKLLEALWEQLNVLGVWEQKQEVLCKCKPMISENLTRKPWAMKVIIGNNTVWRPSMLVLISEPGLLSDKNNLRLSPFSL